MRKADLDELHELDDRYRPLAVRLIEADLKDFTIYGPHSPHRHSDPIREYREVWAEIVQAGSEMGYVLICTAEIAAHAIEVLARQRGIDVSGAWRQVQETPRGGA